MANASSNSYVGISEGESRQGWFAAEVGAEGSGMASTSRRLVAHVIGVGGLLWMAAMWATGQPPRMLSPEDPLQEALARQRVADQKAQAVVQEAISLARRYARSNPIRAAQILRSAQADIEASAALSSNTRRQLLDQLQTTLKQIQSGGREPVDSVSAATSKEVHQKRQEAYERWLAEVKDVQESIQRIARLQEAGLFEAAQRQIADLARRYPDNPAVLLLLEKDRFAQGVQEAQTFARLQADRLAAVHRDILRSSLPPLRDVEFPKDWKQKTERRLQTVRLTEREKKIVEALDKTTSVNWNNTMLEEVLQEISNQLGENLLVDKRSLADLGIDLQRPVSLRANNLSLRTVLRQVLAAHGLTFIVKDEAIQVMTVEKTRSQLVTRVYYLGDLVQGIGPFGGAPQWGTFLDMQQTLQNVELLVRTIQTSIDPLFWRENGGPGSITFHYPSMSIIVRASAEVHALFGSRLAGR